MQSGSADTVQARDGHVVIKDDIHSLHPIKELFCFQIGTYIEWVYGFTHIYFRVTVKKKNYKDNKNKLY